MARHSQFLLKKIEPRRVPKIVEGLTVLIAISYVQVGVAVGTAIADRPPHRSVRAALPHTAPTSEMSSTRKEYAT